MNREDLQSLIGKTIDSIEYDDDKHIAYIVITDGNAYEVQINEN